MTDVKSALEALFPEFEPQSQWANTKHHPSIAARDLFVGDAADQSFEVVTAMAAAKPQKTVMVDVWKERHAGRPTGLLLISAYEVKGVTYAAIAGPDADSPVSHHTLSTVERIAERALEAETIKEVRDIIAELPSDGGDADFNGLRNSGLFAWHSLTTSVPRRRDFAAAAEHAKAVRGTRADDLLKSLGWGVAPHGEVSILTDDTKHRAVAVLLSADEAFDRPSLKFGLGVSPVEHAIHVARKQATRLT